MVVVLLVFWLLPKNLMAVAQAKSTTSHLIWQTINGNAVETVNARELHTFLEVGRDFSTWIKDRISKYEFVENTDYIMLPKTGELENKGLQGKIEYFVTLDMAKQLAMVERNEKLCGYYLPNHK